MDLKVRSASELVTKRFDHERTKMNRTTNIRSLYQDVVSRSRREMTIRDETDRTPLLGEIIVKENLGNESVRRQPLKGKDLVSSAHPWRDQRL